MKLEKLGDDRIQRTLNSWFFNPEFMEGGGWGGGGALKNFKQVRDMVRFSHGENAGGYSENGYELSKTEAGELGNY